MSHHLNQKEPTKMVIFNFCLFVCMRCEYLITSSGYTKALMKIRHLLILFWTACVSRRSSKTVFPVTLGDMNELRARFSHLKKKIRKRLIFIWFPVEAGDAMCYNPRGVLIFKGENDACTRPLKIQPEQVFGLVQKYTLDMIFKLFW